MYIEDKSSGVGLIQELKRKKLKVFQVPRNTDKILRADDASPYIESGRVVLNTEINGIDNLTKEAREFPNSEFDDDIDCLITAVEIAFINKKTTNSLRAAMEA
jgi:predicted phage terminase large subunit-like protein